MDYCALTHYKRAIICLNIYFIFLEFVQALGSLGEPVVGNVAHSFNCFPPFSLATGLWGPLSKPGLFVCLVVFSGHLVVPKKVRKPLVPWMTCLFCLHICLSA